MRLFERFGEASADRGSFWSVYDMGIMDLLATLMIIQAM